MTEDEALLILEYANSIHSSITGANESISLEKYAYDFLITGFHPTLAFTNITIKSENSLISENSRKTRQDKYIENS